MTVGLSSVKDLFAKRFEPNGEGYLFRSDLAAPGRAVSAAERDRSIEQFGRVLVGANVGFFVLLIVALGGGLWFYIGRGADVPVLAVYLMLGALIILYVAVTTWFFQAPVRAFADRPAVGLGLTKSEARLAGLRSVTWGRLGLCVVIALVVIAKGYGQDPTLRGEAWFWFAVGAVLIAMACVQGIRKWRAR